MSETGGPGEAAADLLRRLFEETHPALLRYAIRRTRTEADAEDAVADTYAIAWRRLADIPSGDAVVPWLYGVCRRVLANQRRGQGRRERLSERAASSPREMTSTGEERGPAIEVLARLRKDDQELLTLVAWEGLSHAEIAVALGISVNAVAIRLHRARQRFVEALEDEERGAVSHLRRWSGRLSLKEIGRTRTSSDPKAAVEDLRDLEQNT